MNGSGIDPVIALAKGDRAESHGSCRVCGGGGHAFSIHGFSWLRCGRCGATQKVISEREYHALNPTYDAGVYLDTKQRSEVEDYLGVPEKLELLRGVLDGHAPSGTGNFLDVGCGMGGYLLAAGQLGYDVLGFEPSADHARVATEVLGLPVVNDYFSLERLAGKQFDLIMLSHVIEHIYQPGRFVQDLVAALKPGGVLVIITPNADSLIARASGKHWIMLRPVDHVTLITARAYDFFGLHGVAVRHRSSEYPYEFAATLAAAARPVREQSNVRAPSVLRTASLRSRLTKLVLTVASLPMHLLARAGGRQACLVSIVRKTA